MKNDNNKIFIYLKNLQPEKLTYLSDSHKLIANNRTLTLCEAFLMKTIRIIVEASPNGTFFVIIETKSHGLGVRLTDL